MNKVSYGLDSTIISLSQKEPFFFRVTSIQENPFELSISPHNYLCLL